MEFSKGVKFMKHIVLDIILGTFNLVTTFINIHYLNQQNEWKAGLFSLFLLWFPGIVTSAGFFVLYLRGNRAVEELDTWKLVLYPLILLCCYPALPIVLFVAYLVTRDEKTLEKARISRLFAAFLDHGPQFVLRLVIVVLNGIAHNGVYHKGDVVFVLSMITSFLSLILSALVFNERKSSWAMWLLLSGPMFSAIFACRAFTLAVFVRETVQAHADISYQFLCLIIVALMFLANVAVFRWTGQDWTRSSVFGISSLLLPAGYNNDNHFYQLPGQDLLLDQDTFQVAPRLRREAGRGAGEEGGDLSCPPPEAPPPAVSLLPMKSGRFLLLHLTTNTVLLSVCSLYLYFTNRNLPPEADDALVIPQILGVIPGFFFGMGRSILHDDICPLYEDNETRVERASTFCKRGGKMCLAVVFALLGVASLVPAIFWTIVYKAFTAKDVHDAVYSSLTH